MLLDDALASLDIEGGERFVLSEQHQGLRDPRELPWKTVVAALRDHRVFAAYVLPERRSMTRAGLGTLRTSWAARAGLVDGDDLTRLTWLVKTFRDALEYDLRHELALSLGELWRDRRWRELLNYVDHLPRTTWTQQAMADNAEYAELVADAVRRQPQRLKSPGAKAGPPLREFTPEVAGIYTLIDAVHGLQRTLVQVNMPSDKKAPATAPMPRPTTLLDTMVARAERERDQARHDSLVSRLLPHKST